MFDIMISEWCGQPVPLGPEALQSALERIRALRVDLIKRQTSKVSVDSSTNATNDKRLVLHKDKLIARSFWYEVTSRIPTKLIQNSPASPSPKATTNKQSLPYSASSYPSSSTTVHPVTLNSSTSVSSESTRPTRNGGIDILRR